MNNNGYYALAFDEGGYADISWKYAAGTPFTICVKYINDGCISENGRLIELDGFFSLELINGEIYLNDADSGCKLLSKCFAAVNIVYDGEGLKLYIGNASVYENSIKPKSGSIGGLTIGRGLRHSYICSVTIYKRALSSADIDKGLFAVVSGCEKHMDFTANKDIEDVTYNGCHIENMVYTLDCCKGSLLFTPGSIPKEYTLLFSLYTAEEKNSEDIIFKSGNIALLVERDDDTDRYDLCVDYGIAKMHVRAHIGFNKWADIALVQSSDGLALYLQGRRLGMIKDSFSISDQEIKLGSFGGYINCFTIFDKALDGEKIQEFANTPPKLFDGNVICHCDFSDNIQNEMCRSIPLKFNNSEIVLAKGTNAAVNDMTAAIPTAVEEFDDFEMWEIKTLSRLMLIWLYKATGVYPDRGVKDIEGDLQTTSEFDTFFYGRIAKCPKAQKILSDYDKPSNEKLVEMVAALAATEALSALVYYTYKDIKICKAIIAYVKSILATKEIAEIFFYMLVTAAAILTLASIGQISSPPKRKKQHTNICVEKVSVENTALDIDNCKEDSDTSGVIASDKHSKLNILLSRKGSDKAFTIKAEPTKDNIIIPKEKEVEFTGESAEFILDIQPEKFDGKYGKCKSEIKMSAFSSDSGQYEFLGNINVVIYILESAPCDPWSKSVSSDVLELCDKCHKYSKGSSKGFLDDYCDFIAKQPDKGAGSAREYSSIPDYTMNGIIFDTSAFSKAVIDNKETPPVDKTFSIAMLGALNGYKDMKAICLSSDIYCEYSGKGYISKLILKDRTAFKNDVHYIVMDSNNKVYDAELGSKGLPFTAGEDHGITGETDPNYYRESVYMPGSLCRKIDIIKKWHNVKLTKESISKQYAPLVGIVRKEGGRFIRIGRSDTDIYVQRYIGPRESGQHYCHSISAHNIEENIADICNQKLLGDMIFLLQALYPNISQNKFEREYYQGSMYLADVLSSIIGGDDTYINDILEHFCYLAVNSPCNLRIGNSRWNESVGESFDPTQWFFMNKEEGKSNADESGIDNNKKSIEEIKLKYGFNADPPETGFYLPNENDGIRIHNMLRIQGHILTHVKQMSTRNEWEWSRSLIASSSNAFGFKSEGDEYHNTPDKYKVYYIYNNQWIQWT